ncbi:FAD/NAD(P)-binding domain-containing protein [Dichomitus squalens]|nr:FAD/NAD(P)-binding domain-containing protein [Dichomitus squalens]
MSTRQQHWDIDTDPDAHGALAEIWSSNTQAGHSQSSFSSAVRRNDTTPSKRRRGSDGLARRIRTDHDPWISETSSSSHSRSRTVDDNVGAGEDDRWPPSRRSASQHPLRSTASMASSSSWTLDHETRPSMRRMLSESDVLDSGSTGDGGDIREGSLVQNREMLVIVHEVQPKDSLAGVALKYGITLADLRRANQLWTSDSIHLRKVLYIPVDKTRQARQLREALIDRSLPKESSIPETEPNSVSETVSDITPSVEALPDIGKLTLRRVPASQLSYFPPPTHASSLDNGHPPTAYQTATLPNGNTSRGRPALPVSFTRSKENPLQGVLDVFSSSLQSTAQHVRTSTTTLFGHLPTRAPTTLASRLSLESTSGTPSSVSDDFDWEHEMEDVSSANAPRRALNTVNGTSRPRTRAYTHARQASASLNDLRDPTQNGRAREQEVRDSVELDSGPFESQSPPSAEPRTPTHRHGRSSSSKSRHGSGSGSAHRDRANQNGAVPYAGTEAAVEWESPRGASVVRTAQMEPSPEMQLPLFSRRTKSDPSQLPANKVYDYVVVGTGPGGGVIASRLSEDPNTNVLVIEAGPSDQGVTSLQIPLLAPQLQPNQAFDWNFTTVPQKNLDNRTLQYPRGRVLGGSSGINFMVYTRGPQDDFDRYTSVSGDDGWSWNSILPYWNKIERLVPPRDGHNTNGEIAPAIHGTSGALNISVQNAPFAQDPLVIETTQELPTEFPFNEDMNSGYPLGIGWMQGTYGNGMRSSASTAYIEPVLSRPNLDVLVETTVTKLIQTGEASGTPLFRGVQFASSATSPKYALNVTREVILSAGAVNTPQLLMLSRLGPSKTLSSLNMKTIVDLPDVGQHLTDHPFLRTLFGLVNPDDDILESLARNATFANDVLNEWASERQGVLTDSTGNQVGWLRIPDDDSIWKTEQDPGSGPTAPHFEFLFVPGFVSETETAPTTGSCFTLLTVLVSPSSGGSATIASADPFAKPVIHPNFLDTTFDVYAIRAAVRSAARFAAAGAWNGFLTGQAGPFANVDVGSDEDVDAWARAQSWTIWHPVATARMGTCAQTVGNGAVVNPDATVKGVQGLRVVDASILPYIPAAHPQAVIYAFAERVADLIKSGQSIC